MVPRTIIKKYKNKNFRLHHDSKTSQNWFQNQSITLRYNNKDVFFDVYFTIDFREDSISISTIENEKNNIKNKKVIQDIDEKIKDFKRYIKKYLENEPKYRLLILTGTMKLINFD